MAVVVAPLREESWVNISAAPNSELKTVQMVKKKKILRAEKY